MSKAQRSGEFSEALRALLMQPLMNLEHPAWPLVRRQAEALRDWFQREAGWPLMVARDGARLFKRPADLGDDTRGLAGFDRQRYVLLCLACAVLERAEAQISLRTLAERLLLVAAEPALVSRGFRFGLDTQAERRALVAVCKALLELGVLERVAGDEEGFVQQSQGDALYDLRRRALSGMLAATRGPSTWAAGEAPVGLDERLASLVAELPGDSDEARRTAWRHGLTRRLLDDPVVYLDELDPGERAYFINQRGVMAARLAEATGLVVEQRAEGTALVDEGAELSDVALPAEGTEAHVTLLLAEHLAGRLRSEEGHEWSMAELAAFVVQAREGHGRYWRKSAREAGSEHELAGIAVQRLLQLKLLRRAGADRVVALPAVARYSLVTPA